MRKAITLFFIAFLLLASLLEIVSSAAEPSEKIPVIVGFKDKSDAGLIGKQGGDVKYQYSSIPAVACSLPQVAIEALERNPRIAYIELDGKVQMTQEPPSIFWSMPFDGVDRIDADLVHESSVKGVGVSVSILDTGIDYTHMDLDDNFNPDLFGYDFVNNDNDPMDDNGHGTLCAGIVAAENDGLGVTGVAPEATLYAVKVLDATGSGDVSDVIAGIQWAIGNWTHVISMSLGSTKDNQALHDICDAAYDAGILVVAAAGNDYQIRGRKRELDTVGYPARYDSVIAVGATDNTDMRAEYSSTGSTLELVAPGENIKSTFLDDAYVFGGGTSMACPHVAGTAALILSSNSGILVDEVRNRLQGTADDLGSSGWDSWYGYGLVDANAMLGAPSITKLEPSVGMFINDATPTISANLTDADDINESSIEMTLDGGAVTPTYNPSTGLVSYVPDTSIGEGLHTATLSALDTDDNYDITSWSFTVDTEEPGQVTNVRVDTISSSSLFISWDASSDPNLAIYNVYRKGPDETEYTHHIWVCTYSEDGRAGFFPDTGLEPDTTYYYQITAWDIAGNEGDPSIAAYNTTTPTPEEGVMHVDRIRMDWWYGRISRKSRWVHAEAVVFIVDDNGIPVPGATVSGSWQDATTDSDSGVTNDYGIVYLYSDMIRNPEDGTTFTFEVKNILREGWTYDPNANGDFNGDGISGDTSNSITYP